MHGIWGDGVTRASQASQAEGGAGADGGDDPGVGLAASPDPPSRPASGRRSGRPTCAAQPGPSLGLGLNLEP
eukprot:364681-Chlamydomonas_euryale.AAC.3